MATTWNPADKTATIVLSTGNHVATLPTTGGGAGVRGTTSHASGKWYLEYSGLVNGGFQDHRGFATPAQNMANPNDAVNCFGIYDSGGGDQLGHSVGNPAGHTLQLCVDIGAGLYWVRLDGSGGWSGGSGTIGGVNDPTNGINGANYTSIIAAGVAIFPYCSMFSNTSQIATTTINSGDSAFLSAPPSGFTAWDSTPPPIPRSFGALIS